MFTGADSLQILTRKSDLARLRMQAAHNENHDATDGTLARSRQHVWVVEGRKLASAICHACLKCRGKKFKMQSQRMGTLPKERVAIGQPPFTATCLDLFGPTLVKGMVNKKATLKCWPVLFVCQVTGAVHCELMSSYGTEAFLLQWSKFTSIRGDPAVVVSDRGSQLTSKHNYVAFSEKESPDKWDWEGIGAVGARDGTEWRWVPAGAQFRNGLSERRVAMMKSTIDNVLANSLINHKPTLDYTEMSTLLYRVCNIVNDRPVALKDLNEDTMVPLTVNQLLLGKTRTAKPVLRGEVQPEAYFKSEAYLQELTQAWWNQWKTKALSTLLPFYRGEDCDRHRNLRIGDVCLLLFESKVVADYRLCRVSDVTLSVDDCVRTVIVKYLPNNQLKKKFVPNEKFDPTWMQEKEVAVQRLALIVPVEELEDDEPQKPDEKDNNLKNTKND